MQSFHRTFSSSAATILLVEDDSALRQGLSELFPEKSMPWLPHPVLRRPVQNYQAKSI